LLNTKGWKQFKKHAAPTPANHTSFCMTKQTVNFFEQALHAHQINKAVHPETDKLCECPALLQSSDGQHWQESTCKEIGRLAQGYPPAVPDGTNTMFFTMFDAIPAGRKSTYLRLVVSNRPTKDKPC